MQVGPTGKPFYSPPLPAVKNFALIILLLLMFVAELSFGTVGLSLQEIFGAIAGATDDLAGRVIFLSRLPRALTAMLAGSGLGIAGMLMQTLFRNPLAGPSVLGVSSGASLGVAILVLSGALMATTGWGTASVAVAAVLGAIAVLLVISVAAARLADNTTLLIFGVMLSFFTGALVDALQAHSSNESLRRYITWGQGSFATTGYAEILTMALVIVAALLATIPYMRKLDLFLLGENYAQSMGIDPKKTRFGIIIISGLLAGIATAYCGPVAFIGLAVPHLIRWWLGTMIHAKIWFAIVLAGAIVAMMCDLISLLLNLPLNTVASALGAPVVIWIIIRGNKGNAIF